VTHPLPCRLTTKDYAVLETMLERSREPCGAHATLLRRKLAGADIRLNEDIPADVVTINSRAAFRVNDAPAETRIVAQAPIDGLVGMLLPVTTLRGLALLGLAEGESIMIGADKLSVVEVAYQPEAAHREALRLRMPRAKPVLRLVHSAPELAFGVGRLDASDDPGPSAA
jgi:regulator of nucleoside diphosphate kinase